MGEGERRQILGKRIRVARERLEMTQKELASEASLSVHQIVSQIEKGQREVKAWELAALAKALRMGMSELLSETELEATPIVLWRKNPQEAKEVIEATFIKHCHEYATLEKLCDEVVKRDLPDINVGIDSFDFKDAKPLAENVVKLLNLGSRPAISLIRTLEDTYGVKVWYEDLGEEGSAACTIGSFGRAILMNSVEAPWRRNFSFAHELFHILTWSSLGAERLSESEELKIKFEAIANTFASIVLLPRKPLKEAFDSRVKNSRIEYTALIEIARAFDVSTSALLYRLLDLQCMDRDTVDSLRENSAFRALDRSTMPGKWWQPPEMPERFVHLAFTAYQKGRLSRARLAQYLNTSLLDLTDVLLEYGLDDREDYKAEVRASRC